MFHSSLIWNNEQNKKRNHQRKIDMVEQRGTETKSQKSLWRRPSILHYSLSRCQVTSSSIQQAVVPFTLKALSQLHIPLEIPPRLSTSVRFPALYPQKLPLPRSSEMPVLSSSTHISCSYLTIPLMSSNKGDYLFLHKTLLRL